MTTNLDIPHRLSPEERALLGAADDFGDFPSKGPPRSGVTQLASKDLDPQSPRFVAGAQAGSIVLRYGVGDDEVVKTFDFMPFAAESYFSVYEPDRGIERGAYVETLNEKPADARWQADDIGRQRCLLPNGNEVRETKVVYMIVGDGRIVAFAAHSSGLKPINEMLDKCARLSVKRPFKTDGKTETVSLRGPIISKWRMTTLEKRQNAYRWWVPNATFLGKLGDPNGPSIEECLFARRVRDDFRQSGFWTEAVSAPTAPELPPVARAKMTVTSGRAETPPPNDGDENFSREIDDGIPF